MALVPSALVSAGPVSCDLLDLQVTEHGPHARVVTVTGEIDALTAPKLGALLSAQLAATAVLVIDLARVRFLGSAGLSALLRPMNSRSGKTVTYGWCFPTEES
jgi:anti-anti-sigma factor